MRCGRTKVVICVLEIWALWACQRKQWPFPGAGNMFKIVPGLLSGAQPNLDPLGALSQAAGRAGQFYILWECPLLPGHCPRGW